MAESNGDMEIDGCRILGHNARLARKVNKTSKQISAVSLRTVQFELKKYNVSRNGRKLAIIINIKDFTLTVDQKIPDRRFSEVDEAVVTNLLEDTLGFDVITKHDCSHDDLKGLFIELQSWDYKDVDTMAVVLMSYGNDKEIYTADGQQVKISDLLDNLKGSNCPGLAGKPKIIFINADAWEGAPEETEQVEEAGYDQTDGDRIAAESAPVTKERKICIPKEADFVYVYSPVTFGQQKIGQVEQGNIFLTALSEMCLKLHGEDLELCDLLTRTNRQVAYRVSPAASYSVPPRPCFFLSTLTKELYFPARK